MQESIVFSVRVQCRRKESSRLLSHLLMSFLLHIYYHATFTGGNEVSGFIDVQNSSLFAPLTLTCIFMTFVMKMYIYTTNDGCRSRHSKHRFRKGHRHC